MIHPNLTNKIKFKTIIVLKKFKLYNFAKKIKNICAWNRPQPVLNKFSMPKIKKNQNTITWDKTSFWNIHKKSKIPKVIWTYWDDETLPSLVQACIFSWKKHNPDHEIKVLSLSSAPSFTGALSNHIKKATPQQRADWIRLTLLERYGGIWMDATVICRGPLSFIHSNNKDNLYDAVLFYIAAKTVDQNFPIIENWIIAAPARSPFIIDWRNEFAGKTIPLGGQGYADFLSKHYDIEVLSQKIGNIYYLSMHMAAQVILRYGREYKLLLMKAEENPFLLHHTSKWDQDKICNSLLNEKAPVEGASLIKLRGSERRNIEKRLAIAPAADESIIFNLLKDAQSS